MRVSRDDVLNAIAEANVVDDVSVLNEQLPITDQGTDSLGFFNVILVLQEKYNLEIPDEDVDNINSVLEIVNYLNEKLN